MCYHKSIQINPALSEQLRQLLLIYVRVLPPFHKVTLEDLRRQYPGKWKVVDNFRKAKWRKVVDLLSKKINRSQIRPVHSELLELIIRNSLQELLRSPPFTKEMNYKHHHMYQD